MDLNQLLGVPYEKRRTTSSASGSCGWAAAIFTQWIGNPSLISYDYDSETFGLYPKEILVIHCSLGVEAMQLASPRRRGIRRLLTELYSLCKMTFA